jgi:NAD(P)-dependent dehydrogenase (short-subunit alcohol dehydrogenase family)
MRRLEDKVIIVAGGGGIGSELARRYALEGAKVVLGDLNAESAREVADAIKTNGGEAIGRELDGADERSAAALVAEVCDKYGGLDGIHINFASFADGALDAGVDLPLEIYDECMRVNARGSLICSRVAIPALKARGGGALVYTSSGSAWEPMPIRVGYAMSKSATHALMRIVATRHGPDNIRANVIAPGVIVHPRLESQADDSFKAWAYSHTPIKARLGRPSDIAGMGALLLSDDGSYVTGQVISVDGGWSMRQ